MSFQKYRFIILAAFIAFIIAKSLHAEEPIFQSSDDIGTVNIPGSMEFDPVWNRYTLRASGENMWGEKDAFHFAWKAQSGDFEISSEIAFVGAGVNPHRKACLIVRQSLEPGSAYVDAALHGDGLVSLQFRTETNGPTKEIQSNLTKPRRLKLIRRGDNFEMMVGDGQGNWQSTGCSIDIPFEGSVYVGLGLCSHELDIEESAVFSYVTLLPPSEKRMNTWKSSLETISIDSGNRRSLYHTTELIEAPNWLADDSLVYNSGGLLYRLHQNGPSAFQPQKIDTGFAVACNNDHGISPDGTRIVISDQSEPDHKSRIYTLPIEGGEPQLVTSNAPSYWHGWSPDGQRLAYCAERNGEYNIYTIPVSGGQEKQLTHEPQLDDGPDYSPDGAYIYFNSARTGTMQIWRMRPDGADQEQMTFDDSNDWFPHPSPDGKWIVFISYDKSIDAGAHPADKDVKLRIMSSNGGEVSELLSLFGGQGTINVPSWSPDSSQIAFVRYQNTN